jgi:signal transduction histidine kinase
MARNNDGLWSASAASLAFRVEPHVYQTYWFYALVALGLALVGWAAYRARVRQVEERFQAVLQERNRIAREIHDTLAQGFAGVSVQLELVSRLMASGEAQTREHLDQARLLVRHSLAEARRAIWDLRSQSAENQDFASRISQMAARVNNASAGGRAAVKLEVRGTYRPLTPKVEEELLKIAQEALTNAVRHADAQHIDIELTFDTKKILMIVADDGRGFVQSGDGDGPEGHYGLRGMRERAAGIEARLSVQSGAGKGTRVSVETPIH